MLLPNAGAGEPLQMPVFEREYGSSKNLNFIAIGNQRLKHVPARDAPAMVVVRGILHHNERRRFRAKHFVSSPDNIWLKALGIDLHEIDMLALQDILPIIRESPQLDACCIAFRGFGVLQIDVRIAKVCLEYFLVQQQQQSAVDGTKSS